MKSALTIFPLWIFLTVLLLHIPTAAQYETWVDSKVTRFYSEQKFNEDELKTNFYKFISSIDSVGLSNKYPEIAKKILSQNPREQLIAVNMLSASQSIEAMPWILSLFNSDDREVRVYAGLSLKEIISSIALLRRDRNFPGFTVLKPLQKTDTDLKPMAWIVLKMLRSNEPSLIAYAITMTRYLNIYEFEDELIRHQNNIHPAVTDTLKWAIEELKLQKKYDSNELKKEK